MANAKTFPVNPADLERITSESCSSTLAAATGYSHADTEAWNSRIVNSILSSILRSVTSSSSASSPTPQYKFAVNSTIIQHLSDSPAAASTGTATSASVPTQTASPPSTPSGPAAADVDGHEASGVPVAGTGSDERSNGAGANGAVVKPEKGRRGMHSATGAYWNEETDGMWSTKWEGGENKGLDVVVSIIWMAV